MNRIELTKRYAIFIVGVIVSALGIALITRAFLGTAPITTIALVLSKLVMLSLGQLTFLVNMLMLGGQILILRKDFSKYQFLQIPLVLVFSTFIDIFMYIIPPQNIYVMQFAVLMIGCICLGYGISLEVLADVLILPGEGLVKVISTKLNKEFGTVKTIFDFSVVALALTVSLVFLHKVVGIREGTLIAALTVGNITKFFKKRISHGINSFFADSVNYSEERN